MLYNKLNNLNANGNVLFLILIAVALFAALSYVVTSTTRTGGNTAERESLKLDVAVAVNQIIAISTEVTRRAITGDDLRLVTAAGGIHEPGLGIPVVHPSLSLRNPDETDPENRFSFLLYEQPIYATSIHIGSSGPELFLVLFDISDAACDEFNREFLGTTATQSYETALPNTSFNISGIFRDSTEISAEIPSAASFYISQNSNGCYRAISDPTTTALLFIIRES